MMKISIKYIVLSIMGFIALLPVMLYTFYLLPNTFAQSANCGSGNPARSTGLVTTPLIEGKFSSTGACITDNNVIFAPFKIPTYDDLFSLYFTQSRLPRDGANQQLFTLEGDQSSIDLSGNKDKIYSVNGDLTLNSSSDITGNQTGIIFVKGNLIIGNIPGKKLTHGNALSGLVFIVKGNVKVDYRINQIDAVIISEGKIYTAVETTGPSDAICQGSSPVSVDEALIVNGSLVTLNPNNKIEFCRSLGTRNSSFPAEIINTQPKYLVILKDLLSDTYQKWSEIP